MNIPGVVVELAEKAIAELTRIADAAEKTLEIQKEQHKQRQASIEENFAWREKNLPTTKA